MQDYSQRCYECWVRVEKDKHSWTRKEEFVVKIVWNANELLNSIKIENMTLLEKVKGLELELFVVREQIDRTYISKLDDMSNVQKFVLGKTGLGFVESGSSSIVNPPKFVPATSSFLKN